MGDRKEQNENMRIFSVCHSSVGQSLIEQIDVGVCPYILYTRGFQIEGDHPYEG